MTTALVPTSFAELMQMAEVISGAEGLVPRHCRSPRHAAVLIMRGAELGLQPMESLAALHLIDGKVTLSADTMLRVAIQGGVRVAYPDFTGERVTVELTRPDFEPFRCSWSIADAKRAGLAGRQNWRKYPRAMLRARAVAEALRAYAPDLLAGAYLPEELGQADTETPPQARHEAPSEPEGITDAQIVDPAPETPAAPAAVTCAAADESRAARPSASSAPALSAIAVQNALALSPLNGMMAKSVCEHEAPPGGPAPPLAWLRCNGFIRSHATQLCSAVQSRCAAAVQRNAPAQRQ